MTWLYRFHSLINTEHLLWDFTIYSKCFVIQRSEGPTEGVWQTQGHMHQKSSHNRQHQREEVGPSGLTPRHGHLSRVLGISSGKKMSLLIHRHRDLLVTPDSISLLTNKLFLLPWAIPRGNCRLLTEDQKTSARIQQTPQYLVRRFELSRKCWLLHAWCCIAVLIVNNESYLSICTSREPMYR